MMNNHSNISLKQMRAFVTVAHAGSFTRAAEQLYITQSALSSLIRNLEAELSLRLFDRTTRRLALTDEGQALLKSLERLLRDLDQIKLDLRDINALRRGRVRIGTTPLLASSFMTMAVQSFCDRYPGIKVQIVDDTPSQLLNGLHEGEIDLLVTTLEGNNAALHSTVLLSDAMVLVCPGRHRFAQQAGVLWAEMAQEPVIALRKGSGLRAITEEVLESVGHDLKPAQEVNHVSTAIAMVAAGMGIAALPAYSVSFGEAPPVRAIPLVGPVVERHVSLSMLKDRTPSAASKAMHEHLIQFAWEVYRERDSIGRPTCHVTQDN